MDITRWLGALGLQEYEHAFRESDVDTAVLPELTSDDLIALGVTSIGHRRKLLAAIAALRPAPQSPFDASSTTLSRAPTAVIGAERRQVTVMFCDLVGSTALSFQLDPEDLREVIGAYHSCVAQTIGRYDGFVAKYMGDGVLVYFGYPQAHEDDAERAVRAGLALIDAVTEIATANCKLSLRIGIGTGIVVVGDLIGEGSAQEQAVVGDTPNLAARLQALARPNAVVIGPRTRRLLGDLFEYRDLGPFELAGMTEPGRAYQVLHQSAIESRFEALHSAQLTPLVGREREIQLLLRCWRKAKSGNGQVVLVSGEPGIGKSRLASALLVQAQTEPRTRLRYFCSPYHQDSALYPFIVQLERAAGFARDDTVEQKLAKLQGWLAPGARGHREITLLAELLSLPNSSVDLNLSPRRKREMLFEALLHQFEAVAQDRPVLLVFEDVHWIDPTSRELLDLTLDRVSRLPVLVVITFRPEFDHAWGGERHVTTLALDRLGERDGVALVEQIAGEAGLSREIVDEIVERGDGVPLFLEELTKAVLERAIAGAQITAMPPTSLTIPATLHASLMARLDRLGSAAKEIAQIGAAIGREFSYELLAVVTQRADAELQEAVGRLVDAGLVFQRGTPPEATFLFKHALVQDAAHSTLLRRPRRELHARIAAAIETHFPELMESQPELVAQHYGEAGLVERSVACWGNAGRRSAARSAMAEAAAQFQKGLDQLALLPDDPERRRQELDVYVALGAALFASKGSAAPETGRAYARAQELWELLGSPSEYLQIPYGQSRYHLFRGEFDLAQRLAEDLLRLSRQRDDSAGLVLGHYSSGRNLMLAGRFAPGRSHLEEGLALYDPTSHRALVHQTGIHPHVGSQAFLAIVLLCLGFPDHGLAQSGAAIAEARRLVHLPSLAVSLALGSKMLSLGVDNAVLSDWGNQLVKLTSEHDFPFWRADATIYRGWDKLKNCDVTEGISLLRSGTAAYRAMGQNAWMPHFIALIASACEIAGQIEEALALLDDALQIVARTNERWFAAELYRRKGQLLLRQGHTEAAEDLYRKALSIAKEQEAKLWELRASVALARLRGDQGCRAEARDLLAPVYGWFTEGFDTPDLKGAKALLDELR